MQKQFLSYGLFYLMLVAGCGNTTTSENGGRITTDMLGRKVQIPEKIERIVALNAGMLRLVCWLDATNKVCGVEYNERRRNVPYLYAHPELREKPVIGTGNTPDPELLLSLAPDVILSTYISRAHADKMQERTGTPVLAIRYGNLSDETETLYRALEYLGGIMDRGERAAFLVGYFRENISDLENRTRTIPDSLHPDVYIGGIAYRGSHGITSTEPRYPSFQFLHADNVAESLGTVMTSERDVLTNAFIDKEQLIQWNPEFIFLDMSSTTYTDNEPDEPWTKVLSAAKNGKIHTVFPYNWYTINYSTILVNSWYIGKVLYPERFSDSDPESKAREIYHNILGRDVYDDMVSQFGTCRQISFKN